MTSDIYFGIDFGTTNSAMSWYDPEKGEAKIILNAEGEDKTPSLVYYDEDEILVGRPVEDQLEDSENYDEKERLDTTLRVIKSIKRSLINPPRISIPGREPVRPVDVVAEILKKLKRDAEEGHFNEKVERVVITCPAMFDLRQRKVIHDAALMAGFEEVEVLEEPVAAAMAFSHLGQKVGKGVLIYDLGGGTFDVAMVAREEGTENGSFRVAMPPDGDDHCGGDDFDQAIYNRCDQIARETLGRPVDAAEGAVNPYLLNECRKQKERLSYKEKVMVRDYLDGALLKAEIDRPTFEGMIGDEVEKTVRKTVSMMERAKDRGYEADTVVLVGGSSQVLLVGRRLKEDLPVEPRRFAEKDYAVALGAAYHAYELWKPVPKPDARDEYRKALQEAFENQQSMMAWGGTIGVLRLGRQASELGLSRSEAAGIEREILGDTKEAIQAEQEEVRKLAQERDIDLSRVKGSGKGGRVTRREVEAYIEELERKERERSEKDRKEREHSELEQRRRQQQPESQKPSIVEVTDATFESEVLGADKPVIVDFWAPWCVPCRRVSSILVEMSDSRDDVRFVKLNVDDNPGTAMRYLITSIPTIARFENGQVTQQAVGDLLSRGQLVSQLRL